MVTLIVMDWEETTAERPNDLHIDKIPALVNSQSGLQFGFTKFFRELVVKAAR